MFHSRIALTPEYRRARLIVRLQGAALAAIGLAFYGFALANLGEIFAAIAGAR